MPLTASEGFADLPQAVALFNAIKEAINSLPPNATYAQSAKAFGAADGSAIALAAELADIVKAQVKS
jgi:hypothetical protein